MPVAIALSIDPVSFITAMSPVGIGVDEADVIGGVMGEPVEIVKCKTLDLEVPARAEVILEGEVLLPDFAVEEGPFGEFTGYRTAPRMSRTVIKINHITYRNNPIIWIANMGVPMYDGCISIGWQAAIRKALKDNGIPVKAVNLAPECGATCMAIVATDVPYHGIANRIANIIFGAPSLCSYINYVVVVEPDVDVYDYGQVLHMISAQCHPERGITIRKNEISNPLNPYLSNEERKWMWGSKAVLDCTTPVHWSKQTEAPPKVSFKLMYPKQIQDKIVQNWQKWGFKSK
jgi:4-hydroxy-3-polyprenylbenzoate decarboxylase